MRHAAIAFKTAAVAVSIVRTMPNAEPQPYIHGYDAREHDRLLAQAGSVLDLLHRDTPPSSLSCANQLFADSVFSLPSCRNHQRLVLNQGWFA
jgi:hypothetical protein